MRQPQLSTPRVAVPVSGAATPAGALRAGRRGLLWAVLGCLVLMALGAAPALAAPEWSAAPINLVEPIVGRYAEAPQIAVDAKGDAVAVWEENGEVIKASVRPASSGKWETPVALSTYKIAYEPQVAIDAEGEAVVVWHASENLGTSYIVQAATGSASTGKWQKAVNISPEEGLASGPRVAVDATGQAVVVWRAAGSSDTIEAAVGSVKGEWQKSAEISDSLPGVNAPQVTIDSAGDAVAVWEGYNGEHEYIQASSRPPVGVWQTPVTLSNTSQEAGLPSVAADGSGDVLAVWANRTEGVVQSVMGSAASGTWQKAVNVSATGSGIEYRQVALAVNARGNAIASWENTVPSDVGEAAEGSAVTGQWQQPTAFSPVGQHDYGKSKVAIDPQGDALVVWIDGESGVAQSAARPTGEPSFSAPVNLSATGLELNEPLVAFGGEGIGVAVWENGDEDGGTETIVQASEYTGTVIVPVVPTVVTGSSSAGEQTSATVTGTVNPNGSEVSACYFEYGTSTSYGSKVSCSQTVGSGEARVTVSATLSGLSPGTTYYYRVIAKNTAGLGEGDPKMFTTPAATPSTTPTTTTTSTTPTTVTTTVAPQPSPALECTTAQVALINVVKNGSRVLITGAARLVLAGQRVSIKFLATGKTVASATIAANGTFSASAPLPPAKIRESNRARYEASVGSLHSLNLKLTRRMYMTSATRSGTHVLLAGYVTGSFKAGAKVKILARITCSKEEVIAKVKLTHSGKFSATVPAPTGAASQVAVYRATTTVLNDGHPETTYTLPTPPSG